MSCACCRKRERNQVDKIDEAGMNLSEICYERHLAFVLPTAEWKKGVPCGWGVYSMPQPYFISIEFIPLVPSSGVEGCEYKDPLVEAPLP